MMRFRGMAAVWVLGCGMAWGAEGARAEVSDWPAWRGPLSTGVSPDATPPLRWDERTNLRWKKPIPGRGVSTPIVWRDRIFITTAVETERQGDAELAKQAAGKVPEFVRHSGGIKPSNVVEFTVMALSRSDGSVLWRQVACEEMPHEGTHADGTWASGSAVTDGERLYVYFGSFGLYAYDLDGRKLWEQRLGQFKMRNSFGEGVSPVLCGDQVIVNQDQEGPGFIAAFDRKTGRENWRIPRNEITSWATPLVLDHNGQTQIVVAATQRIRAYDPRQGATLWEIDGGLTANVVPTPVTDRERVFCMSGFRGSAMLAINLAGAQGDLTGRESAVAWRYARNTPYVPSPLLMDGRLYFLRTNDAVLTCLEAASGAPIFGPQVLEGCRGAYASPVAAAGRIYVTARNGRTLVLKAGAAYEVLADNLLDDSFSASAALAGRDLFLRGFKALYCIAEGTF